jgi:dolichyl-phosphate-mannose--protein O-mannosyl transferase
LAVVAIALGLSVMFQSPGKKHFISLPLLLATIYYVMPMTVFHHTKDMKLDPGLLFVSISAFMVFFSFVSHKAPTTKKERNELCSILALIGILIGFAFSIKLTSLMLLVGILGLFAYRTLSFW